jgi:hypothetical protein
MEYPVLKPIKTGWMALGDGWAVDASTKEEAIVLFREAERRHQEIMSREDPFGEKEAASSSR